MRLLGYHDSNKCKNPTGCGDWECNSRILKKENQHLEYELSELKSKISQVISERDELKSKLNIKQNELKGKDNELSQYKKRVDELTNWKNKHGECDREKEELEAQIKAEVEEKNKWKTKYDWAWSHLSKYWMNEVGIWSIADVSKIESDYEITYETTYLKEDDKGKFLSKPVFTIPFLDNKEVANYFENDSSNIVLEKADKVIFKFTSSSGRTHDMPQSLLKQLRKKNKNYWFANQLKSDHHLDLGISLPEKKVTNGLATDEVTEKQEQPQEIVEEIPEWKKPEIRDSLDEVCKLIVEQLENESSIGSQKGIKRGTITELVQAKDKSITGDNIANHFERHLIPNSLAESVDEGGYKLYFLVGNNKDNNR